MQNKVFVLDTNKKQLDPVHPAKARILLDNGKAAVYRQHPFTIILKDTSEEDTDGYQIKIDPGSKVTGIAIVDGKKEVVWAAEIEHRGDYIKRRMDKRRVIRRSRRTRKTRYRPARFDNRRRPEGWLPPSLISRVANIETWVKRLQRLCPITAISYELTQFDTQRMENAEIEGVEYQQGELQGYTVRQYVLEKFDYQCAYCGKTDVPLEMEHIMPKVRGGTNRVSNLAASCISCNRKKGSQTAEEYGHREVQKQAKKPLKDAAAVNTIRWEVYNRLKKLCLPMEVGTGARTKYNRSQAECEKQHWLDAAFVGESGEGVDLDSEMQILNIKAQGHGRRQMCLIDKHGFPRTKPKDSKKVKGFQTGDMVRTVVTKGKKFGTYYGRVAVRKNGIFNIKTKGGTVQGVSHRYCNLLQFADGYGYAI